MARIIAFLICIVICLSQNFPVVAQDSVPKPKSDFAGDYAGLLGPLHVKLHLIAAPDGALSGTVDSPDQGLVGVPCTDIHTNGQSLSFSVPMVHGAWIGFLSADGKLLSGMWNQGTPLALNLTRVTAAAAAGPAEGSSPAQPGVKDVAGPASNPSTSPSSDPPCPPSYSFSYLDGSAWKPMMLAVALPKERGVSIKGGFKDLSRNPLNPTAGQTNLFRYKDAAAPLTLGPNPRFCVTILPNYNPSQILIGAVEVKKDHRELEQLRSADSWLPEKEAQAVEITRISANAVEITPKRALPPGQYVIGGYPMIGIYDFGVHSGN